MSSRIEQKIEEMEEYIDSCKFKMLSNTTILVDKDEIEELIRDLRALIPEEIKEYQRIIQNREVIFSDADAKAKKLLAETTNRSAQLLSEHEIMRLADAEAKEVMKAAHNKAQELIDRATLEANGFLNLAVQHTDEMLAHVERLIESSIQTVAADYGNLIGHLQQYQEKVISDRQELAQAQEEESGEGANAAQKPAAKGNLTVIK